MASQNSSVDSADSGDFADSVDSLEMVQTGPVRPCAGGKDDGSLHKLPQIRIGLGEILPQKSVP